MILDLSRQRLEYAALSGILEGEPSALLFVTFFGETEAEAAAAVDRLAADWAAHGHGYHTLRAVRAADRAALLKVRKASLGLLMAASTRRPAAAGVRGGHRGASRAAAGVRGGVLRGARPARPPGRLLRSLLGRLSAHPAVRGPAKTARRWPPCAPSREEILELVVRYGGVNSSEHGDGLARSEFNRRVFGDELLRGDARGQGAVRP